MQALLFDLDDTLYDLSRHRATHLRRAWAGWLAELAPAQADAVIDAAVRERIFFPDMPAFLMRQGVRDTELRECLIDASKESWFSDLTMDDGVPALLDALATRYRLGLITNGPAGIQGRKIAQFGLQRWFAHMTISETFGVEKPHPSIFLDMLTKLGTTAAASVMVGDNPWADIAGAHSVGMRAVWIRHPHIEYPPAVAAPWREVTHVTQLRAVVAC